MPGHIAPTRTMSLIHDLPYRRHWRFQRRLGLGSRFRQPSSVVRYSTEDDNGLRKQSRQEEAPGPVVLAPGLFPETQAIRVLNSLQSAGTLQALAGGVGDMIHWASKRTPNPWDARSREAKLSLIVQPGEESIRESSREHSVTGSA